MIRMQSGKGALNMTSQNGGGEPSESGGNPLSLCPREVNILKFAEARASEMETMSFLVCNSAANARLMQSLPIHMRRRAMSHNAKRFPRYLQATAAADILSQKTKTDVKRPRKKYRHREKARIRKVCDKHGIDSSLVWLKTHVWHAKRFKMKHCWGYSMPYKFNEKCLRKVYRDVKQGTLVQDISFFRFAEIIGDQETITRGFARITNSSAGDAIDDKEYLSGRQRGQTTLYKADCYPRDCIGPVSFLWMPEGASSETSELINVAPDQRKLWIWTHPACYQNVLATLEEIQGCQVIQIKDSISAFRLFGADCSRVLTEVFVSAPKAEVNDDDVVIAKVVTTLDQTSGRSKNVFSAMVKYPTLHRTHIKKQTLDDSEMEVTSCLPDHDPLSPIFWSDEARRIFNADVAEKLRGRALKSDFDLHEDLDDDSTLPILLIRLPASSGPVYCPRGWEVILPSNAAMLVWKALVFRQARPVGMHEWQNVCTEFSMPVYPYSYPDSQAGSDFYDEKSNALKETYNKRPPGKRPNFETLKVMDPFECPWQKLVKTWMDRYNVSGEVFVLRDQFRLGEIHNSVEFNREIDFEPSIASALLAVDMITIGKGTLDDNSMIVIPTGNDLENSEYREPSEVKGKSSVSRDVIGYLYLAGYSLRQGCCSGQGFVSLLGLSELLKRNHDSRVLVRATGSMQYRFARIKVRYHMPSVHF